MKRSAGILLHRRKDGRHEVLLVHPGGPFWAGKDAGSWSIPKGEFDPDEEPVSAARREFREELGLELAADAPTAPLTPIRQKSGKIVHAWAVEGNLNIADIVSNTFELEWPPKSGRIQTYPEVNRAEWFDLDAAAVKINAAQVAFLQELEALTTH